MSLKHLKIRNFRNLAKVDLELSEGINLFYGANAQGKTAILEAIRYLATSVSHRTRRDAEMIRWHESATYVCGIFQGEQEKSLEFGLSRENKQVKADGELLKRISDLYGRLRVVLFVPEDLEIINGSPSERRRFIDITLAQVNPEHIIRLQKYQQCLKSRNQLLKWSQIKKLDTDELEIWSQQLVDAAIPVIQSRRIAIREIADFLQQYYNRIAGGKEILTMRYFSSVIEDEGESLKESFHRRLEAAIERDKQNGSTSMGPHRDDLQFILDHQDLRIFGSQGQRRTGVLALRLAELQWLREKTGQHPVLLIDDVIYEMDENRRKHFFEQINQGGQVFITSTEVNHLAPLVNSAKLFRVEAGKVEEG